MIKNRAVAIAKQWSNDGQTKDTIVAILRKVGETTNYFRFFLLSCGLKHYVGAAESLIC